MTGRWRSASFGLALPALFGGCQDRSVAVQPASAELPDGTLAQVGTETIAADTVARITAERRTPAAEALALAIRDALLALGARDQLAGSGVVRSVERSALARALLERIQREARAQPVTDAEVAEITARHWLDLDRPASARTTHAVVLVTAPEDDRPALQLARRIAEATAGVTDPAAFIERAQAVPAGSLSAARRRQPWPRPPPKWPCAGGSTMLRG